MDGYVGLDPHDSSVLHNLYDLEFSGSNSMRDMGADGGTWDSMDGEIHSRDKTPVPIELVRVNNVNTLLQQAPFDMT
uniref:Uncharacterized protein n=1 Tax=Oryza rufipogon TaxID=4529 RepID=A0A0E0R6L1_ORYRU